MPARKCRRAWRTRLRSRRSIRRPFRRRSSVAGDHLRPVLPLPEEGSCCRASAASSRSRSDRIAQDLDQAAKLKGEADAAVAAYEQELAEAKAKANAIGQQARDAAKAEAEAERKKIEAELDAQAWRGRGPHRRDQGHGHEGSRRASPRIPPRPSSRQLVGGKVDKADGRGRRQIRAGLRSDMDAWHCNILGHGRPRHLPRHRRLPEGAGMIAKSLDERADQDPQRARRSPPPARGSPAAARPSTSASARKPRRKLPTSSPLPSARPSMLVAEAQQEDRGLCRAPHRACRAEDRPGRARGDQRSARQRRRLAVEAARTLLAGKVDAKAGADLFKASLAGSEGEAQLSRLAYRLQRSRLGNLAAFLLIWSSRLAWRAIGVLASREYGGVA